MRRFFISGIRTLEKPKSIQDLVTEDKHGAFTMVDDAKQMAIKCVIAAWRAMPASDSRDESMSDAEYFEANKNDAERIVERVMNE